MLNHRDTTHPAVQRWLGTLSVESLDQMNAADAKKDLKTFSDLSEENIVGPAARQIGPPRKGGTSIYSTRIEVVCTGGIIKEQTKRTKRPRPQTCLLPSPHKTSSRNLQRKERLLQRLPAQFLSCVCKHVFVHELAGDNRHTVEQLIYSLSN